MHDEPPTAPLDTPIERVTIDRLPLSVLEQMLADIRERRLAIARKAAAVKKAKQNAVMHVLVERYNKQYARLQVLLVDLDSRMTKAETAVNKLRALELEIGDEDGSAG